MTGNACPIATLDDIRLALIRHTPVAKAYRAALDELERRARIEARRDAWLKAGLQRKLVHDVDVGGHTVRLYLGNGDLLDWPAGAAFQFPDYWSALEHARNAAGAP